MELYFSARRLVKKIKWHAVREAIQTVAALSAIAAVIFWFAESNDRTEDRSVRKFQLLSNSYDIINAHIFKEDSPAHFRPTSLARAMNTVFELKEPLYLEAFSTSYFSCPNHNKISGKIYVTSARLQIQNCIFDKAMIHQFFDDFPLELQLEEESKISLYGVTIENSLISVRNRTLQKEGKENRLPYLNIIASNLKNLVIEIEDPATFRVTHTEIKNGVVKVADFEDKRSLKYDLFFIPTASIKNPIIWDTPMAKKLCLKTTSLKFAEGARSPIRQLVPELNPHFASFSKSTHFYWNCTTESVGQMLASSEKLSE